VALDVIEREIGITLGERRTLGEISKRVGADEVVALEHALEPLADDLRREQFGERGCDRLEQGLVAHEVHIGLDRKARRRQQARERDDVVAAAPFSAQRGVVATRDQARVLHRDDRLVIVARLASFTGIIV
jgi:hypothetical protein